VQLESVLEESARTTPRKTALIVGRERFSYGELAAAVSRAARALVELGVARGDRVAICLDNGLEAVVALFATLEAGAAFVMMNPTTKAERFEHVLRDSGATLLVLSARKLESEAEAVARSTSLRAVVVVGSDPQGAERLAGGSADLVSWRELAEAADGERPARRAEASELAGLLYTSGSTGNPKGVMHSHGSLMAAVRSIASYLGSRPDDVVLSVLPLSFGYGLTQLLPTFLAGGTLVLERSFAFPQVTLQRLAAERATGFAMVPTIATILLQNDLSRFDLGALRYVTNAGAGIAPEILAELRRRLPSTRIFPMYGQTECMRASFLPPEEVDRIPESVGRGIPDQEMWIEDDEGRRIDGPGTGELVIQGAHVALGYWNLPRATAEKIRPGPRDGVRVLRTDDLFRVDDEGWYYFVSRRDDIIKTRGEKVSPREVENALHTLEGVLSVAVVGVPDRILGETVKAFVVRKPGSDLDAQGVLRHAARHLEDFAIPKEVLFVDSLPLTPNGKIDRRALRTSTDTTGGRA
jgi:amino acid adenylation domain-containing protein